MYTLAEIRCAIRKSLGSSSVNVELADCDIDTAISNGIDEINSRMPGEGSAKIDCSAAQHRYVVSHRNLIDVTNLQFMNPRQATGSLSENPFLNINFNMGGGVPTDLTWVPPSSANRSSQFYNTIGSQKDAARVFSTEPIWNGGWEYNEDNGDQEYALYVHLADGMPEYLVSYRYLFGREASDAVDCGIPTLTPTLLNWLKKYSLAYSRIILGDIRNKFKGIPGPDTMSSAELDGSEQIQRGQDAKDKLIEELNNMQRQLPPVIG